MKQTVIILGARGRFGRAALEAFLSAGWEVRASHRPGSEFHAPPRSHSGGGRRH